MAKSSRTSASAKTTELDLHFAVWDNDLALLAKLLEADEIDMETQDRTGATPLTLAFKLGHTRAAHMLIRAGACPRARTPMEWEAHQLAAFTANTDLLRIAVLAMLKDLDLAWERRLPKHLAKLRELPDFEMKMTWDFTSWIPFVSTLLPRDTVTVSKRGTAVRVDSTLLGFSGMSWGRGSISFLVQGEEQGNPGAWFVMDNELKTAANARAALTNPPDHTVQDWVRKLLSNPQKRIKWNGAGVRIVEQTRSTWMGLGERATVREDAGSYRDCDAFSMSGLTMMEWKHPPVLPSAIATAEWWSPSYSTAARRMTRRDRHPGILTEEGAGGKWPEDDGVSGPTAAGAEAAAVARGAYGSGGEPEAGLSALKVTLASIRDGDVSEGVDVDTAAAEAAAEAAAAAGDTEAEAAARAAAASPSTSEVSEGVRDAAVEAGWARSLTFDEYFRGDIEGAVPHDVEETHRRGVPGAVRLDLLHPGAHVTAPPGATASSASSGHPSRVVADAFEDNLTLEEKEFSGKVLFAKDFPLTPEDMLPFAEVMSLSSKHFGTIKRFFETRMPKDRGFPVQFSLPVFPTVTATVKVESMNLTPPPESNFRVPPDYEMGKYVERTAIRQVG